MGAAALLRRADPIIRETRLGIAAQRPAAAALRLHRIGVRNRFDSAIGVDFVQIQSAVAFTADATSARGTITSSAGDGIVPTFTQAKGTTSPATSVVRTNILPSQRSIPSSPQRRNISSEAGILSGPGQRTVCE